MEKSKWASYLIHSPKQIYRLLYDINAPVDVIVETPERFEQLKDNRFLIYKDIAKHGQVIYEQKGPLNGKESESGWKRKSS